MDAQPELPDPLSIPLPDDIPLPDEIPLPPVDEEEQKAYDSHHRPPTKKRKRGESTPPPNDDTCESEYKKPCSEEALMSKLMGFTSFNSTKGKPVPGNQSVGAVHVVKRRRYRQYMNRKGGFNRPLDKVN